ncbi:MAG: helix-turn-helix domain-containing protein [Patescibacteria group bacterium]
MPNEEQKNFSSAFLTAIKNKGVSFEKLAQATGISERFLKNLAEDNLEDLPAAPYVHGYLIRIAEALGLNGEKMWIEYQKSNETLKRSGKNDELPKNRFESTKINTKIILILVFVMALVVYFGLLLLPQANGISLNNLKEDTVFTASPVFNLSGNIDSGYELTVNGERIYPTKDGDFEKDIPLGPGFNTLSFDIKKFLGKKQSFTKQIFYATSTNTDL